MYKVPVNHNAQRKSRSQSLVGAPALALVAWSLLDNVLVGVALLAGLVTTFGLFKILSAVWKYITERICRSLPVFPR
jgi:hypothetical protein